VPPSKNRQIDTAPEVEESEVRARSVREGVAQYLDLIESPDPLAIGIILSIWEISGAQRVAHDRAFDELDLPVNVGGNRLTILRTLYFAPERQMSVAVLSRETGLTVTWVTSLVETLSSGGLVQRTGDPGDRRVTIVCLTPAGEDAFRAILPAMAKAMSETCKQLDEAEKQQLHNLLHRLL
jgi:DNA-binding MarR family transcriptional regulator